MMIYRMTQVLLIFIVLSLISYIYTYHNQPKASNNKLISDEIIIKLNTEIIQKCTSFDATRQERVLHSFLAWTQFANTYNIRYWLGYGTLLGYVRRGGLLPQDHDVDVMIKAHDTQQLSLLSSINFSSFYELNIQPQWQTVDVKKRHFFRAKRVDFISPNARLVHRKYRNFLDIWPVYDSRVENSRLVENNNTLTHSGKSTKWVSTPMHWTFPLKPCKFSGLQVWCPAMPEKILTTIYGEKALNTSDKVCVNGKWIRTKV